MDVKVPRLGESAEGGVVLSILVKEGDAITEGQTILELENEKAVAPIPSTASGVVSRICVKEGDPIAVGQLLLTVAQSGSTPAGAHPKMPAPKAQAAAPIPLPAEPAHGTEQRKIAETAVGGGLPPASSPEVRRIARLLGLDLRGVPAGTAPGRLVMADLRAYIQRLEKLAATPKPAAPGPAAPAHAEPIDFSKWGEIARKPMSALRKTISRRMAENWNAIPHVTQLDEADITGLMDLRKKFAPKYEQRGARLTLTSFALKAAVKALKKHPLFNSSLDEMAGEIVLKEYYHIGLAVETDQGLIVPVIRRVDQKSLWELSKEVTAVAEKARERKVSLEDLKGGTFTISNQGGIGGAHFTPIVNKPEVAILGLGKAVVKPVVRDQRIEPRLLLPIAVSYDHRLIDGGSAARFTVDLLEAFESFQEADLELG